MGIVCVVAKFVIFTSSVYLLSAECQTPWVQFQSSCYYFSKTDADFIGAEKYCKYNQKGFLAIIDSPEKTAFINNIIHILHDHESIGAHWIGGTDFAVEGEWRWVHTSQVINYTNWGHHPYEPNGGDDENCIELREPGYWLDRRCDTLMHFICEKTANGSFVAPPVG